jgi:hypothetical protein
MLLGKSYEIRKVEYFLVTLMMEALSSYETSVLTRATWRNISEVAILHIHRCENLKSNTALTGWTL